MTRSTSGEIRKSNDLRRLDEADVQWRTYVKPLSDGYAVVKSRTDGIEFVVSAPTRKTFRPGSVVPTGSHTGFAGEFIIDSPGPPAKRGVADAPAVLVTRPEASVYPGELWAAYKHTASVGSGRRIAILNGNGSFQQDVGNILTPFDVSPAVNLSFQNGRDVLLDKPIHDLGRGSIISHFASGATAKVYDFVNNTEPRSLRIQENGLDTKWDAMKVTDGHTGTTSCILDERSPGARGMFTAIDYGNNFIAAGSSTTVEAKDIVNGAIVSLHEASDPYTVVHEPGWITESGLSVVLVKDKATGLTQGYIDCRTGTYTNTGPSTATFDFTPPRTGIADPADPNGQLVASTEAGRSLLQKWIRGETRLEDHWPASWGTVPTSNVFYPQLSRTRSGSFICVYQVEFTTTSSMPVAVGTVYIHRGWQSGDYPDFPDYTITPALHPAWGVPPSLVAIREV